MTDDQGGQKFPEDIKLEHIQNDPDRRMTREEWEREESLARDAAHRRHKEAEQRQHEMEQRGAIKPEHADSGQGHSTRPKRKRPSNRDEHPVNWAKVAIWGVVGVVVLLLIFFLGWLPHHHEQKAAEAAAKEREQEDPQVEVVQVKRAKSDSELTVPGTTAPLEEAFIYARANGYLSRRLVDIGDHVRKGQLLAVIDAPDLDEQVDQARQQLRQAEAQLEQQKAQLALAKVTWERWKVLVAKGVFSRQDGDQREADYESQVSIVASAERNVESYRANLGRVIALQSYERVTSPFDGVITQRNADVGALVGASGAASTQPMQSPTTPSGGSASQSNANTGGSSGNPNQSAAPSTGGAQGGPIFAVAKVDTLRVLVSVPEGYASSLRTGMPAKVFLQERPDQPFDGRVSRIAGAVDQNTRTMLSEVDIDNRAGLLYPGAYVVTTFTQVRGVPPLIIPGDAVVVRKDKTSVAIVKDDKIQMVPIQVGRDYGPSVEVLNGLQGGEWVVATVTDDVQPGAKVKPHPLHIAGEDNGSGGAQNNQTPAAGPNQYGDQSIVNSKTESTTQQGKKGGQQQQGGSQSKGKQ